MDRREFIMTGAAAAVAAAMPPVPAALATEPLPAWCVGSPGEMDWEVIFAETEKAALRAYFDNVFDGGCDGCDPENCECFNVPEVNREPRLDQYSEAEMVPNGALFDVGWTVYCSRCGYETSKEGDCGKRIGDEAFCFECIASEERS